MAIRQFRIIKYYTRNSKPMPNSGVVYIKFNIWLDSVGNCTPNEITLKQLHICEIALSVWSWYLFITKGQSLDGWPKFEHKTIIKYVESLLILFPNLQYLLASYDNNDNRIAENRYINGLFPTMGRYYRLKLLKTNYTQRLTVLPSELWWCYFMHYGVKLRACSL